MAITLDDFNKIWASTSPLTPYSFSDANYKEGWNFVGATPPSRQMWDFLQKNNDEKMQYLADNYLPLSGGTMTGAITFSQQVVATRNINNGSMLLCAGTDASNSYIGLFGKDNASTPGMIQLRTFDGTNSKSVVAYPDGRFTWDGKNIEVVNSSVTNYIRYESGLQICFDRVNAVTTSGTAVTFPVAFSETPRISAVCATNAIAIAFSSLTSTGCTFKTASGSQAIDYYAVGHWK